MTCARVHYTPPEYLLRDDVSTAFSEDVWAFGLIVYELISGTEPFLTTETGSGVDITYVDLHNMFVNGERPCAWSATGPEYDRLWDILQQCWQTSPDARPTMEYVSASVSAVLA